MKTADLHMHTNHSDGTLNPVELARLAKTQNLDAVALTDHDTVTGLAELVEEVNRLGIEAIPGVELSVNFFPGTLHILGYGFDPHGPIRQKLEKFQKARAERNPQILEKLKTLGMALTLEEVKELSGAKNQIGRPHIAKAMEIKKYVASYEEAFDKYLTKGGPAYIRKTGWTAQECINLIHESGGVAVIAHPIQMKLQGVELRSKLKDLADMGMDGLEVVHPDHSQQDQALFVRLAGELGLLPTGGSDFHGDHKPGVQLGQGRPPYAYLEALRGRMKHWRDLN